MVDGHKVFALIGREGKTDAYLDIPPGLDPQPFLASRVGVRGQAHFNEDLGTRLITVRDLESIEQQKVEVAPGNGFTASCGSENGKLT